eukprot:Transcript_280.p1 GENE.Transcript_280~~Transcript_280.p1  ORF type:complete len:403 (+),score=83.31 Transcript_280:92-1300(+)
MENRRGPRHAADLRYRHDPPIVCMALLFTTKGSNPESEHRATRNKVLSWFKGNSDSSEIEIEARVKDVSQLGFDTIMRNLMSNRGWSNQPKEETTLDLIHASGVRETRDNANQVSFLRKQRHDAALVMCGDYEVRFAVASENRAVPGRDLPAEGDTSEISTWRYKRRIQFVHKGLFSFDLTKVKQGATQQLAQQADTQYEIEVEFCGQADPIASKEQERWSYLTDSMLMKARPSSLLPARRPRVKAPGGLFVGSQPPSRRVPPALARAPQPRIPCALPEQVTDLVRQLVAASSSASQQAPPAKRPRTDGALQRGDQVSLVADTAVALAPAGQDRPSPFGGELPAEVAVAVPWLFSHIEESDDGPQAHIMNLPCGVDDRRYPLYYLCGNVPAANVVRRPPGSR